MIAAGYEDANNADSLRHDPAFKLALGRLPDAAALCSQPTISRLENLPRPHDLRPMSQVMVALYCTSCMVMPEASTSPAGWFEKSVYYVPTRVQQPPARRCRDSVLPSNLAGGPKRRSHRRPTRYRKIRNQGAIGAWLWACVERMVGQAGPIS